MCCPLTSTIQHTHVVIAPRFSGYLIEFYYESFIIKKSMINKEIKFCAALQKSYKTEIKGLQEIRS